MSNTNCAKQLFYVFFIYLAIMGIACARTIMVDIAGGGEYTSIQAAVDAAVDGEDEIKVGPGTYLGTVDFKGKAVRVYSSDGPEVTTIDGRFIVFEDNFDDVDFDGWQIVDEGNWSGPSDWSAASGAMVQSSNIYTEPTTDERYLGTYALSPESISLEEYSITLTMKSDDDDWMGVMFCYQDENNYYRFSWNGTSGGRKLVKCQNGAFSTLASDNIQYVQGETYDIKIWVRPWYLVVYVDDVWTLNIGDDAFRGGPVGLYCWANGGTHFDDISVQPYSTTFNVVQCVSGEGSDSIMEGFTITSTDTWNYPYGMYNEGSSPTVTDCIFGATSGSYMSSGIDNRDSSPMITGCTFRDIVAETGGGICNYNSTPAIANCVFSNNQPNAIYNSTSNATVTNCSFSGYWSQFRNVGGSDSIVTGCTFTGRGMNNGDSSPVVTNCTFSLSSNSGMYNSNSSPTVTNCTFAKNSYNLYKVGWVGGGMCNLSGSNPTVVNSIFWDNGAAGIYDDGGSGCTVRHSNVEGGWPSGEGNIDLWPFFVNSGGGDFRLGWHSPCIDAGDDAAVAGDIAMDLDGRSRRIDGNWDGMEVVDMGAYEYSPKSLGTSLEIGISPQEAIDAGAAWRLAGQESWLCSGETINNLLPGYYEVQFKELDGWFEPDSMWVCVIRDLPVVELVQYRPVGTFDIGQIPPGEASHGETLAFYVYSDQLGPNASLTMSADPAPLGEITFDADVGLFVYRPDDEADVAPFEVTFTATLAAETVEQGVEVTPVPDLPAEYTLVNRPMQNMPDAESRDYLFVNEVMSETDEMLNGSMKPVRSISISGKTVVFDAGHSNGLYESYNSPEGGPYEADIKEMTIYAETVIVGDRLHLPQTNLAIYARRIQFTGADARISTTPYDARPIDPGQMDGLDAGDITLHVESYIAEPDYGVRFTVVGTTGHNGGQPGEPGHLACTLEEMQPLAWLSPYSVKMVLAHARDAYLYGYASEARDILADYQTLLDACMNLPEWDTFDDQWQLEFEQLHGEIVTLLHRIQSGLDYFVNPPGWVPMLSFEVSKAFYEQEIDRAVRVLYLSYWVQNKATTIADKAGALARSRQAIWSETQDFADQYAQIQALIPKLKSDATRISARIGRADSGGCSGLLCQLKQKEDELVARADRIVQKRHEVPWWKKALKGLATVVTSTISGAASGGQAGAAAGLATGSITALSDEFLTQKDPWPAINNRTGVAKTFNGVDFEAAAGDWLDGFDDIPDDLNVIEQNGAGDYLQGLRSQAASMAGGMHQIKEALKETSLSNDEVEAELKKIKAKDPIFNSLVDQVTQLAVEKEVFNRQLLKAMQKVSTLSNGITNNLLAIDGMNRDASHLNRVLDPRASMYVKDMERRALERLQKYHYYLARSYEYRLLEPSPMDLNIGNIFGAMQSIVSADGSLDQNSFNGLKTVYEEQLWDLTDQIYRDYQENKSYEATAPVRLELTSSQIADLNAGEKVIINLKDAARFQYNEENTRIVDVEVDVMEYHVEGLFDIQDYFDLEIEHAGVSRLQKDGEIYQFVHYKDIAQETNPLNWNERHFSDGYWQPVDRSDASESMLFSLLENCQQAQTGDIMVYARPGAWADIVLKKTPHEENSGDLVIDSVRLLIRYDRIIRPGQYSTLQIVTEPQNLLPHFEVDTQDNWGRQDGVSDFYRTYGTGSSVNITAPLQSGNYTFVKWTDGGGTEVEQDAALSVYLDGNRKRIAGYVYTGPVPSAADFNQDFFVNVADLADLADAWRTQPGDGNWNSACDISEPPDEVIDIRDLQVFTEEWLTMPQ